MIIGIIGIGVVGKAMLDGFTSKGINNIVTYDKNISEYMCNFKNMIKCDIIFLALPTPYSKSLKKYDISNITKTLDHLCDINYRGIAVIKSTLEPHTTENLAKKYKRSITILHNPEFLSAKTALHDFINQSHIILGYTPYSSKYKVWLLADFYRKYFPDADISICQSNESETVKLFCNSFYAVKVQFFTELYMLCHSTKMDFNIIRELMVKNGWINDMHTYVPGPDGNISFGGMCFPKDTSATLAFMEQHHVPCQILNACVKERNGMRHDTPNVIE